MADADKIKDVASSSAAMAQSDVWYQLYYENGEKIGDESSISPIPKNISYLKDAIKAKDTAGRLSHCNSNELNVYRHGTNFPLEDGSNPIRPRTAVPVDAYHTLVVVAPNKPAQGRPPLHSNESEELRRDVRHVISWMARSSIVGFVQPTESAATRGENLLRDLKCTGNYRECTLESSKPSVMSSANLTALKNNVTNDTISSTLAESILTALLSSHIMEALAETASGLVLSNTESHKWLPAIPNEATKNRRKPDLFTAHPLRISPAQAFGGNNIIDFRKTRGISGLTFGGLDMKRDAENYITSMWEGKVDLGNLHAALGEMVDYVRCWGIQNRDVSIILYDVYGFVVGDCRKSVIRTLYKLVPWDKPGSKAFLKTCMTKYVTPQIRQAQEALVSLKLRVENPIDSPYLGSGSYGDVFRVINEQDQVVALKVPRSTSSTFCKEYSTLEDAHKKNAPVVQVLAKAESSLCAAYTMTPVGLTLPKTMDTCRLLFPALKQLHDSGWFHGDARYPNAIKTPQGTILWIDFFNAGMHNGDQVALVQDKITLGLSCLGELSGEDRISFMKAMNEVHDSDNKFYSKSSFIVSQLHEKMENESLVDSGIYV